MAANLKIQQNPLQQLEFSPQTTGGGRFHSPENMTHFLAKANEILWGSKATRRWEFHATKRNNRSTCVVLIVFIFILKGVSVLFHKDSWKTLLLESSYPTSINGMEYTESIYIYTHLFVVCGYCVHVSCKNSDGSSDKHLQAWDPTKSFLVTMKYRHVPYGAGVFLSCNFCQRFLQVRNALDVSFFFGKN